MLVWQLLREALGRFLYQDLVSKILSSSSRSFLSRSCAILLGVLVWRSWPSLLHLLVRRSCGDPSGIPSEALHDLVQVLVRSSWRGPPWNHFMCPYMISYRSLWEDLVEILVKWSSSRGPCIKILKMLWIGDCLKSSCVRSCIRTIYIEGPSAAVSVMFKVICYCSISTVACICYIDFLPATLFGASCRCNCRPSLRNQSMNEKN